MQRLSAYLGHSSIHGVRYLLPGRNRSPFGRLFWLLCLVSSLSVAGFFIYSNWLEWYESPSMVTSVESVAVKDQPWMPKIMVCPDKPVVESYLRSLRSEDIDEELIREIEDTMDRIIIQRIREKRVFHLRFDVDVLWAHICPNINDQIDSTLAYPVSVLPIEYEGESKLLSTLSTIYDSNDIKVNEELLEDYIFQLMRQPFGSKSTGLEEFLEFTKIKGIYVDENANNLCNGSLDRFNGVLGLYSYFFSITGESLAAWETLPELHTFSPPQGLKLKGKANMIEILEVVFHVMERQIQTWSFAQKSEILKVLGKLLSRRLESSFHTDTNGILAYFDAAARTAGSSWAMHAEATLISRELITQITPMSWFNWNDLLKFSAKPCGETPETNLSLIEVCEKQSFHTKQCQSYCDLMHKFALKEKRTIHKTYENATLKLDELLPYCYPGTLAEETCFGQTCWSKVITNIGICYSTSLDVNMINAVSSENAFNFGIRIPFWMHTLVETPLFFPRLFFTTSNNFVVTPGGREDLRLKSTIVEEGEYYYWQEPGVSPPKGFQVKVVSHMAATEEFQALSAARRRCYFPNETYVLQHFELYSESNCIQECGWLNAAELCMCIPWFLVETSLDKQDLPICEVYGNTCFDHVSRRKPTNECKEKCLPDCEKTTYRGSSERDEVFEDTVAQDSLTPKLSNETKQMLEDVFSNLIDQRIEFESSPKELSLMSDVSLFPLSLRLDEDEALVVTKTVSLTTTDMISNMGGALGLFCGFSILSGIEVFYWLCGSGGKAKTSAKTGLDTNSKKNGGTLPI